MASTPKKKNTPSIASASVQSIGDQRQNTASRLNPGGNQVGPPPIPKSDTKIQHSTYTPTAGLPVSKPPPPVMKLTDSKVLPKSAPKKPAGVPRPATPPTSKPPGRPPTPPSKPKPPGRPSTPPSKPRPPGRPSTSPSTPKPPGRASTSPSIPKPPGRASTSPSTPKPSDIPPSSQPSKPKTSGVPLPTPKPKPASVPPPAQPPKPKPMASTKPATLSTPRFSSSPKPDRDTPPVSKPANKFQNLRTSVELRKSKSSPSSAGRRKSVKRRPSKSRSKRGSRSSKSLKKIRKKLFRKKSKVAPGKAKRRKSRKKKKMSGAVTKDGEFIPSHAKHQDESFKNVPHSLLIEGIEGATTAHMTLTLGNQGEGRDLLIYNIYDEHKRRLCTAEEKSKMKGGSRPFVLKFLNDDLEVAFNLERAKNFTLCCFGVQCCGSNATVNKGEGSTSIGRIKQLFACGKLQYEISDNSGKTVLFLGGPNQRFCLRNYIGNDAVFQVYVGNKEDLFKELCGDMRVYSSPKTFTDDPFVFTVNFLTQMDPERKILILAAGTLMYLSYYENNPGFFDLYGNLFWFVLLILLVAVVFFLFVVVWILL